MSGSREARKTALQKLLDVVERVGDRAPHYEKNAGVGTIVAMMLPYTVVTSVAWLLLFFAWFLLGLPFGPG
jgi:aminobenzoyl-glutamate transport protein